MASLITPALAHERIGSFLVLEDDSETIVLDGEIDINTPLDMRRALALRPEARRVLLNSGGGLVASGLIIAQDLHDRGLSTVIPESAGCYSACVFVFFAGVERLTEGELGVHQMYGQIDAAGVQLTVSDIIETLERFDTPTGVITRMFRTPSDEIYIFGAAEIEALGINRLGPSVLAELPRVALTSPGEAGSDVATPAETKATPTADAVSSLRLAIYEGLDFYGADIASLRTVDAVECTMLCLDNAQCAAFTFNANPRLTRGPNCFLKGGVDRLEAYADAFSGIFLSPNQGDAITYAIGAIDPTQDVLTRTGLTGTNLRSSPEAGITSPGACRMACVDNNACVAFTYDSSRSQCFLKQSLGSQFSSGSLTSGIKRGATFQPVDVISLSD